MLLWPLISYQPSTSKLLVTALNFMTIIIFFTYFQIEVLNCSTVKVSWAGQVSNNSHLTGCNFDLQMFSKTSPYNSIYRYIVTVYMKSLATVLAKSQNVRTVISQIFKAWCRVVAVLICTCMYVCKKYIVVQFYLQLKFSLYKILFVFCSGLDKEFIIKELRPGTQYKFRFVLVLLDVFSGGS